MKIIETSAKDNINVSESFINLIDKMLELGLGRKKGNEDDNDELNNSQVLRNPKNDKENRNGGCCLNKLKK